MDVLAGAWASITWWENDGTPADDDWTEHTIDNGFSSAYSVYAADVDGDGDMDVLGASKALDDISWWENDGTPATGTWTEHPIDAEFDGAWSVNAADVDGDGDMDVLGAAYYHDDITWWENDGSQSWTEHTIDPDFNGAFSVYAVDVDGDGDME